MYSLKLSQACGTLQVDNLRCHLWNSDKTTMHNVHCILPFSSPLKPISTTKHHRCYHRMLLIICGRGSCHFKTFIIMNIIMFQFG